MPSLCSPLLIFLLELAEALQSHSSLFVSELDLVTPPTPTGAFGGFWKGNEGAASDSTATSTNEVVKSELLLPFYTNFFKTRFDHASIVRFSQFSRPFVIMNPFADWKGYHKLSTFKKHYFLKHSYFWQVESCFNCFRHYK